MTFKLISHASLLATGLVASLSCAAVETAQGDVSVTIKVNEEGSIKVRYVFPTGVSELRFSEADPISGAYRKANWKGVDDCATVTARSITRKLEPRCEEVEFVAGTSPLNGDRMYQPGLPLDDGVLLHTKYYAVQTNGMTNWKISAPEGWHIAANGNITGSDISQMLNGPIPNGASADERNRIDNAYVAILRSPSVQWRGMKVILPAKLPEVAAAEFRDTLEKLASTYTRFFGPTSTKDPVVVFTTQRIDGVRTMSFSGEMSYGLIRINVFNPDAPLKDEQKQNFRLFAAHELFHAWNSVPALFDSRDPWLVEGNAEWIAFNTVRLIRQMDDSSARSFINRQVNECLLTIGRRPWKSSPMSTRGSSPYRCGFMFHMAAGASFDRKLDPATQLTRWAAIIKSPSQMSSASFPAAVGDGTVFVSSLYDLLNGDEPFDSNALGMLKSSGIDFKITDTSDDPLLRANVAYNLFAQIQRQKCRGVAFQGVPNGLTSFNQAECPWQTKTVTITGAQGISLVNSPLAAGRAIAKACAAGQAFSLDSDDTKFAISCPVKLDLPVGYIAIDI